MEERFSASAPARMQLRENAGGSIVARLMHCVAGQEGAAMPRLAFSLVSAGLLALGLAAAPAGATTFVFSAPFLPEGGPGATGTGTATVTFDDVLLTMRVEATFSGTSGTTTASHIHCCTVSQGVGTAGVATQVPSFSGFPLGVTSGSYDQLFDMNLASSWNPTYVTNNGGTTTSAFNALLGGILDDRGYLNIHTSTFGGGEIRARLALVPEPGTVALLGLGLAALAARRR
jgi:hypothetical protein